jgi:hypothetical protein
MRNIVYLFGFFFLASTYLASAADEAPATFKVSEFTFTRPSGWEWVETSSSMRKAQLKVSDAKSKGNAEVVFFFFGPGGGGGAKANVDRWFSQFQDAKNKKTDETKANGTKITYVQTEGTYLSGMPGGAKTPMPDQMLQGAILESEQGDVFVKMTGPIELVKSSKDAFRKMVETAKK